MTRKRNTRFAPLPAGSMVDLGSIRLELDAPSVSGDVFAHLARTSERRRLRVLEAAPGELPDPLARALSLPFVATPEVRADGDERHLIALRSPPGPTLAQVIERAEALPYWSLDLVERLAQLFQELHEAKLGFHRVDAELFCVAEDGTLSLECPDELRELADPAPGEATAFSAPEATDAACQRALADQYALGALAYSLFTGRLPLRGHALPAMRTFRRDLPHGVQTAISRATAATPSARYPDCASFLADLRTRSLPRGGPPQRLRVGAASEIGRIKGGQIPVNQDAWFAGYDPLSGRGLLLIADGISTADVGSGDLASGHLRDCVRAAWEGAVGDILRGHKGPMPLDWARTALEAILEEANARIFAFLKQPIFVGSLGPRTHPPGTTAVLALVDGDRITVANVGDSRLYLLRDGALEQLTVDQDVRTDLLVAGRDPRNVAEPSALGALTRSVGSFFCDAEGGIVLRPLQPDVQRHALRAGDRLLFCTDGVPDCLGEDAEPVITRALGEGVDAEMTAYALCRLADDALGADNITALVVFAT